MPKVGIMRGCNCKTLSFHLSTHLVPLFPPISGGEESQASCTALFPGNPWHREGAGTGLRGSGLCFCDLPLFLPQWLRPTLLPLMGTSLLGQAGTSSGSDPAPPLPAIASQACSLLPLSRCGTGCRCWSPLSIHQSTCSAGGPSSPPSTPSFGTGRPDRSVVSAGCRQTGELQAEALCPNPMHWQAFLFRL